MKVRLVCMLLLFAACSHGATRIRWEVETARPGEINETVRQGETVTFEPKFKDYGIPRAFGSSDWATLYYQTNGMGSEWFTNKSTVISLTETGRVVATWTPDLDIGASKYKFFIGVIQSNEITYRAAGSITMKASPGFLPAIRDPSTAPFATTGALSNHVASTGSSAHQGMVVENNQNANTGTLWLSSIVLGGEARTNWPTVSSAIATGSWRNPTWFALMWSENPTSAPSVITIRTNQDQIVERFGFNNTKHDRVAQISEQHSYFDMAFSVMPSNLASISQSGYLTHISDGVVTAKVEAADFARTNLLILRTEGKSVDRYLSGTPGSLRAAAIHAVDANVTNASMQIFSSIDTQLMTFVRNTNLWLKPDPECLAAWNSNFGDQRGGVLITRRHAIAAWHFSPQIGDTLTWVSSSNEVHQAVVLDKLNPAADICLLRLDRDVPRISLVKFIPNPASSLPNGIREIPLAAGEVHGGAHQLQLVIGGSATWGSRGYMGINWWKSPEGPAWRNFFFHYPASGDSSQPVFLTTGNDLVLLFCLYFPTTGPDLHAYINEIQSGISSWGDTNAIEYITATNYTEF